MEVQFSSILVSVTEGCHVGCAHCGFLGSTRERETLADEMVNWIDQLCYYGVPNIIFTGGEPFERFEVLKKSIIRAYNHSVPASIFTSSYWADTTVNTETILSQLPGIYQLYLSTDIYHQRRVPVEYVHNVILTAQAMGIPKITMCITYANETDRQQIRNHYELFVPYVRFYETRVIPTPFIQKALVDQDPMQATTVENYEPNCWINTPIVNPNGDVFACHAGKVGAHGDMEDLPYYLGNLRQQSFQQIMTASKQRADYQYLRTHGPKGIAKLYEEFPSLRQTLERQTFTGPCDMCYSVLATMVGQEKLREYVQRPEVLARINMLLHLRYQESPIPSTSEVALL